MDVALASMGFLLEKRDFMRITGDLSKNQSLKCGLDRTLHIERVKSIKEDGKMTAIKTCYRNTIDRINIISVSRFYLGVILTSLLIAVIR